MTHAHGSWRRAAGAARLLGPEGDVAPTVFAEMSALAAATGAINLGQGYPDEDTPDEVRDAALEAISSGQNQYAPGRGAADLLDAVAHHQRCFYGLDWDPATEIIATAGATEALAAALLALLDGPDDEVVVFEPFYDAYAALIGLAGARLVPVPLTWPDFQPDLDELTAAVTDHTRVILVNDPHNPTGTVFSPAVKSRIVELAERHDAVIVTDEVYEHLVFEQPHLPIAALPGAARRTVSISSGGKTFRATGWKIGWITAPADLVTAVLAVKQYLTYANGTPFQPAIARGLVSDDGFFERIAADMRHKASVLGAGLAAAGFEVSSPDATYFTVADASALGFDDAAQFCRELPHLAGVIAVPLTAFVTAEHHDDYRSLVRFAACKRLDVLEEAASRLAEIER